MCTGVSGIQLRACQEYSYRHRTDTVFRGVAQLRSTSLCGIALSTNYVDPNCKGLTCLLASRLIRLNKRPGVQPIGVGEVLEELLLKLSYTSQAWKILKAAGDSQLCAGHISGCEAGVHAMTDTQVDDQTEGVLLVDASNVFNFLNREAAMKNIQSLCPPLAKIVVNTYINNAPLFIDGEVIPSQERTTQGDPLAMCINAIATIPLICMQTMHL